MVEKIDKTPVQDKVTLSKAIQKVKFIAENEYEGNVYENIMLIFNQLSNRERTVLLRGLIGFCFMVEDQIKVDDNNSNVNVAKVNNGGAKLSVKVENDKNVESEIQDLNTINALELIKLKGWFFRTLTYVLIIAAATFILFNLFVNDGTTPMFPYFNDMFKIFKLMFGLGSD